VSSWRAAREDSRCQQGAASYHERLCSQSCPRTSDTSLSCEHLDYYWQGVTAHFPSEDALRTYLSWGQHQVPRRVSTDNASRSLIAHLGSSGPGFSLSLDDGAATTQPSGTLVTSTLLEPAQTMHVAPSGIRAARCRAVSPSSEAKCLS